MGYKEALEASGLVVEKFEMLGDWQGTWCARLADNSFIVGYYGSCSGCDAFEGTFCYTDRADKEKLRKFGESYHDDIIINVEAFRAFIDENYSEVWNTRDRAFLLTMIPEGE